MKGILEIGEAPEVREIVQTSAGEDLLGTVQTLVGQEDCAAVLVDVEVDPGSKPASFAVR